MNETKVAAAPVADTKQPDPGRSIRITGRSPGTMYVYINDERQTVRFPPHGPPLIEHPTVNWGRPTSVLDLQYREIKGFFPRPNMHLAPLLDKHTGLRDYTQVIVPPDLSGFETANAETLHDEAVEGRGRDGPKPRYDLAVARSVKRDYWNGVMTIRELARRLDTSEPAIARIVHGLLYWYA